MTVVGRSWWETGLVWVGFPLVGAVVGWFARPVAEWALGLAWVPFQGPLQLIESLPEPQATYVLTAAGVVLGVMVALTAEGEVLRITVDDRAIRLRLDEQTHEIAGPDVGAIFLDGKDLVVLGVSTEELVRLRNDRSSDRLSEAFTAYGYPWRSEGDPYRDDYRRWADDTPDLPGAVNAVFRAREHALENGDQADAASLRTELAKLGIVVRDEGARQHWRRVPGWAHD